MDVEGAESTGDEDNCWLCMEVSIMGSDEKPVSRAMLVQQWTDPRGTVDLFMSVTVLSGY